MLNLPSKLLLYPQTFIPSEMATKIFPLVSKIVVIKLPRTLEIMEAIYKDFSFSWKEIVTFLELKKEIKVNWEEIEKEVRAIEEWGLNFRTPENLKYFSQFKETLEESLEEMFPSFSRKKAKEKSEEAFKIKRALILLCLAENLDFKLSEVEKSLREIEKKYNQIFEEKIIGEDETFEKIANIKEPLQMSFYNRELPNLNLRIFAWKLIGKYLDWDSVLPLSDVLITDKNLLEEWKEKFSFEEEKSFNEEIKFYRFKTSIFEMLEISEVNFSKSSSETGVVFLNL
ncbi:MAG: hypothetical protein H0Z16_03945 [Thermodesulfobacterium sp.]|nr:hypothetical protein [Thermodesulfobacterium sp.]